MWRVLLYCDTATGTSWQLSTFGWNFLYLGSVFCLLWSKLLKVSGFNVQFYMNLINGFLQELRDLVGRSTVYGMPIEMLNVCWSYTFVAILCCKYSDKACSLLSCSLLFVGMNLLLRNQWRWVRITVKWPATRTADIFGNKCWMKFDHYVDAFM